MQNKKQMNYSKQFSPLELVELGVAQTETLDSVVTRANYECDGQLPDNIFFIEQDKDN